MLCNTGTWYYFLEMMGYISVMTNLGVVVFTNPGDFFNLATTQEKIIAFVFVEVRYRRYPRKVVGAWELG